ncbi:tocopherol cyclase family protein [Terrisporobacter sp.]
MKEIFNPNLYHGAHKRKNFFEGWYYKIVDKKGNYKIAIIPGVSYGNNDNEHHCFIQIVNGIDLKYNYLSYGIDNFKYNNNPFRICVNSNIFTLDGINLSISQNNFYIKGNLVFKNTVKWPDSMINPGSMGLYNYLKFMECYSQVCVLNGSVVGCLAINEKNIDFTGGKIYIEKNWGKSFPKSWLWIQCNSFKNRKTSLTCSLGTIPFLIKSFTGFLIGITIEDKFYSFTTMNHSKIYIQILVDDIILTVTKKNLKLTLKTHTNADDFLILKSPTKGCMTSSVKENLNGQVYMLLEDTKLNKIIFEDIGTSTGIEYGGDFFNSINKK